MRREKPNSLVFEMSAKIKHNNANANVAGKVTWHWIYLLYKNLKRG